MDTPEQLTAEPQVFRAYRWPGALALLTTIAIPFYSYHLMTTGTFVPGGEAGRKFIAAFYIISALAILITLIPFLLLPQSVTVNNVGIHFKTLLGQRSFPWDEMLSYDSCETMGYIDIMDITGHTIRIRYINFQPGLVDVLAHCVAGSRGRAFDHIDERGLSISDRYRVVSGLFGVLFFAMALAITCILPYWLVPIGLPGELSYVGFGVAFFLGIIITLVRATTQIRVDRFTISRMNWLSKKSITFTQMLEVRLWTEPERSTEMVRVEGHAKTNFEFSEAYRNFELVRDYVISKAQPNVVVDLNGTLGAAIAGQEALNENQRRSETMSS